LWIASLSLYSPLLSSFHPHHLTSEGSNGAVIAGLLLKAFQAEKFIFFVTPLRGSLGFGEEAVQSLPGKIGSQVLFYRLFILLT